MVQLTTIYRDILESMAEGIIFADTADLVTFVNHSAEEIRGIKAKNFIGRPLLSIQFTTFCKADQRFAAETT